MAVQHHLLAQYHASMALYLQYSKTHAFSPTPPMLGATLSRSRGALNFSGMDSPVGETEQRIVLCLTPQELHTIIQGIQIAQLTTRLTRFVHLSEAHGGDISLVESEDERVTLITTGQSLLGERHDLACQLEGIRWWLQHREELRAIMEPALIAYHHRLAQLDALWQKQITHFLPFNPYRRFYRDVYPHTRNGWWWRQYADCDLGVVYQVAAGDIPPSRHLHTCPPCQHLLQTLTGARNLLRSTWGLSHAHHQAPDLTHSGHKASTRDEVDTLRGHLRHDAPGHGHVVALQHGEHATNAPDATAYVFLLPKEEVRVAAGSHGIQGLPGQMMYHDEEVEVWINAEGGRVILRVYGTDLSGLSALDAMEYTSYEARPVVTMAHHTTEVVWELGGAEELRGKSMFLSLRLHDRAIALPRCDLLGEEAP